MDCEVTWHAPAWNEDASRKHRLGGPHAKRNWERSITKAITKGGDHPSVYDPNLNPLEIERIEMQTIDAAFELPQRLCTVRYFARDVGRIVGACNGEFADWVFVKYNADGSVHGYPLTQEYLKRRRLLQ